MTRAVSVEKKLAIAEAKAEMWQEKANRLSVELVETRRSVDDSQLELSQARGYFEAELKRAQADTKAVTDLLSKAADESNGLRSIIRDLELAVERHRGYHDGLVDGQPPRMVPEEREARRDSWPYPRSGIDREGRAGDHVGFGAIKPWWHR